jgi:hypothetical protein
MATSGGLYSEIQFNQVKNRLWKNRVCPRFGLKGQENSAQGFERQRDALGQRR